MKTNKMAYKVLSVLMAALMLFGVMAPAIGAAEEFVEENFPKEKFDAIADENGNIIYTSIGDSMTNGYGIDGYDGESGIMNYGINTYANLFAAYLAGYTGEIADDQTVFNGTNGTVDHRQLAMSGMRSEDLAWLLQLDYKNLTDDAIRNIARFRYAVNEAGEPWQTDLQDNVCKGIIKGSVCNCGRIHGWQHEWGNGREYWYSYDVRDDKVETNGLNFASGDWRTWTDLLNPSYRLADGVVKVLSMYGKEGFGFRTDVTLANNVQQLAAAKLSNDDWLGDDQWSSSNIDALFNGAEGQWLEFAAEFYQESIADADVITLALGNTNFGTFMFDTIKELFLSSNVCEFASRYNIKEVYLMAERANIDDGLMEMIKNMITSELEPMMEEQFAAIANEVVPDVDGTFEVDPYGLLERNKAGQITKGALIKYIVEYCVLSYVVGYIASVDRIVSLNPDVEIIQIALMNAYKTEDSEPGSFADIIDMLYDPMNALLAALPQYLARQDTTGKYGQAKFYFSDTGMVETLSAVYGDDFYTYDNESITYDEYQDMLDKGTLEVSKLENTYTTVRSRFHAWIAGANGCKHDYSGGDQLSEWGAHAYISDCYLCMEIKHGPTDPSYGWGKFDYAELLKYIVGPMECPYPDDSSNPTEDEKNLYDTNKDSFINKFFNRYRMVMVTEADVKQYEKMTAAEKNAMLLSEKCFDSYTTQKGTAVPYSSTKDGKTAAVREADWAFSCAMYLALEEAVIMAGTKGFTLGDLTAVEGMTPATFKGVKAQFAVEMGQAVFGKGSELAKPDADAIRVNFRNALLNDGPTVTMLCLANRMQIGSGIGGHPSEGGHADMAAAIQRDYANEQTSQEGLMNVLESFLKKNYPNLYESMTAPKGDSDDLATIVKLLKLSDSAALAGVDLDALEAQIRQINKDYVEAHPGSEEQAKAQAAANKLYNRLIALAAASTGMDYVPNEKSFYVSLGDSNVNGLGLPGYNADVNGGFGQQLENTAPGLLAQNLFGEEWKDKYGQFAMGSLRSEDMLYLLDYSGDDLIIDDYYTDEVSWRVLANFKSIEDAQAAYIAAIQKADLISVAIGGGNVSTFTGEQVDRALAGEKLVEMDWTKIGYTNDAIAELDEMLDTFVPLMDALGMMDKYLPDGVTLSEKCGTAEFARTLLESLLYGYASYNYYYPKVLERIREINPDAQLLILGMFNPIDDWTMEMEDENGKAQIINIGGITANLMEMANLQNLAFALQNANTAFVDVSDNITFLDAEYADKEEGPTFQVYYESILEGNGEEVHANVDGHAYMYGQMMDALTHNTSDELKELLAEFHNTLTDDYLTTDEKLELLGEIYDVVRDNGGLTETPRIVLIKKLYDRLSENDLINDDQTLAIILCVYEKILDLELTNAEIRKIAHYIYFDVFKAENTEPVALFAAGVGSSEGIATPAPAPLTPAKKLEVIQIVFNVLEENEFFETAPELAPVKELYENLGEEIDETELLTVMDIVVGVVTDPVKGEDMTAAAAEIIKQIMESDISPEAKMTIVTEVTKTLANSSLGNVAGIPDLSVINALRDALKDYVTDEEAANIIGAVTSILLGGDVDYVKIADVVYANLLGGHTAEEKIAIIGIIYTVLDEYGYVELGVINAYIYAYNLADQKGYIDTAIDGIDAAIAGIENAIEFVKGFETEDIAIREKMVEELKNTLATLEQLKADLAEGKFATLEGSINTAFEYKDNLIAHRNTLTLLAKEIGLEIDPYIIDFVETVDFYANMINDIVVDAYNFAVATNDAFVKGYKDFTATAVKYASMIDPELGAAVEKFLTETPADAMAIVHRYGKDSLLKLVVDAAAASDKIEVKALALVQILIEHGETIYNAVVDTDEFDALVDRLEETKAELLKLYEEYEKAPVATALKYEEQIAILEKELYDLGSKLYDLIMAASETVDPEIAEMLDASVNALLESLDIVDTAVDGYLTYLDGAVKAMAGDLLASLLENATELGDTAWNVLMKLLYKLNDFLYAYVNNLMEELEDIREVLNNLSIKLWGIDLEELEAKLEDKVDAALKGEYTVTEDSYLAVIGGSYGDRLADALGLTNKYTGMTWDAIDLDELAKADFVVLGYDQAQINGFAADQLAAALGEYLDTVIRETANEYADRVINEYFDDPSKVEALTAEIDALIDEILASELFAGKTVETMDWADLIGAENVQYVDEVRDGLYALLAKKGITNDFTYTLDLAAYIADAVSLKVEKVYEILGDDAYITFNIPAADFAVLAVESYLYSNAVFQKTYSETILALNEQNPDVTIAVLGQYNPFVNFEELPLADIYEVVAALASAHSFGYAVAMPNVTYVDISAAYKAEETDLMSFILEYLGNADALALDEAGEQYVLDQILNAYGLACQHVYDDECTDTDCNACGEVREAPGHDYVAVVTDPTCTEGGYTTYTCSKCGDTYVADEVEALGHDYVAVVTDPTCTEGGYTTYTCDLCGDSYVADEVDALGHKWVDATCTEPKTCSVCGETEGEALGHKWVDATCTEPKTCDLCGETEGEALGHKWVDATCTTPKTCSVCGETEGEALGHTWVDATCTTPKTCSVCGETEGEALGHKWVDATCTEPKTCSVCGETEGEALGHTYDNACDADCNVCGATRTPAEHQFGDWYVVVEATEEAEGKEERKCSVCGHTESRVIPMLEKTGLSTGAVVAIVCGSVAVVAGGAAAALFVLKKKKIF